MSTPGHHCDVVVLGDVDGFHHAPDGRIVGLVLRVDVGELAVVPVILDRPVTGFQRGDRVWLTGEIRSLKCPGQRYALVYVAPTHLEIVKRQKGGGSCPSASS